MGDSVSKFQVVNSCINKDETPNIPRYHFKCRFSEDDEHCTSRAYTRTKDTFVRIFNFNEKKIFRSINYSINKIFNRFIFLLI